MKIIPKRKQKELPQNLRPALEEGKKEAARRKMTVPAFVLPESDYESARHLFEKVASHLTNHPFVEKNSSDIHVLICRKETSGLSQLSPFLQRIKGTTISGELIALFLDKTGSEEARKEAREEIICSILPHEFYHAMRMQLKALINPPTIGSDLVEEGLAEVFRVQEQHRMDPDWTKNHVTSLCSRLDNQCIAKAQSLWGKLNDELSDTKELKFDGCFYFCFVAATLERKGLSITKSETLKMPTSELLDPWSKPSNKTAPNLKSLPIYLERAINKICSP